MRFPVRAFSTLQGAAQQQVALVQGSSRGLGLEFVTQLLSRPDTSVIATCRNPEAATGLQQLQAQHRDRLAVVRLDVASEDSIREAAQEVSKLGLGGLNLLLNAGGVLHIPGQLSPETALARVTLDNLQTNFQVNAFGPILVCKEFAPLLAQAKGTDERPAVIANMSARVGSIGDNGTGGWLSYRGSKTALNQMTKTMALEFERRRQKIACVLLHPGTVDTDLSKPFQKNVPEGKLFTRERAVRQLLGIIDGTTMAQNGKYFAWDGQEIPW